MLITNDSALAINQAFQTKFNSSVNGFNYNKSELNSTFGINAEYAFKEFEITEKDVGYAIDNVTSNNDDTYISEMVTSANIAIEKTDSVMENAHTMSVMNEWKHFMNNAS